MNAGSGIAIRAGIPDDAEKIAALGARGEINRGAGAQAADHLRKELVGMVEWAERDVEARHPRRHAVPLREFTRP